MSNLASYLTALTILSSLTQLIHSRTFILGYLTGSQRRPGDLEYPRPGLTISGAISLAVAEANSGTFGDKGHKLEFVVAETYGEEVTSIKRTAELWMRNVSGYIGPQETCVHEGKMAAAFNLPMISYFCTDYETSNKHEFPTFARTRPPDTQISKSVASVLLHFNWKHVVLFYPNSSDVEYEKVASTILHTFQASDIYVRFTRWWDSQYHHGYMDNPFHQLVEETYEDTRIYVILGHHYEHVGLMVAMEEKKLFDKGEYWVVGVDIEQYEQENPAKYLRGLLRDELDLVAQRAFRSYLGIVASSPVGFENFTLAVNAYMERPPFNFPNPLTSLGGVKRIRAEAAYLYDAVHLYARAVLRVLESGGNPLNGTAVIESIKRCHYNSAMGYMVYMDDSGDAEGNYTLLARKSNPLIPEDYGLYPVGIFTPGQAGNGTNLPVLHLTDKIDWIGNGPPIAAPPCGFRGEKCITHTVEITAGVAGSALLAVVVAGLVLYRNWRYEQELDSLLWKVDYRDIQVIDDTAPCSLGTKVSRTIHPLVRTSQVSLSSNPDADFRYSSIFTQIGIYRGRVFAIKKVYKKSIDITREMKKELKMMRDLRHDNLNAFIGACTDPPNICIITEYCARGSLKDILENEDVKLDNMFIASLVGDILRGMIYLHESPVRFHGALHTANCLVDSRWVVKIADYGLHEFKRGAEDLTLKDPTKIMDRCLLLLYRAPEMLRSTNTNSSLTGHEPRGSQRADIYSFGIILYELHSRKGPFGDTGLSPVEMLKKVVKIPAPGCQPYRPQLDALENSFDFVRDCLKECWAENPDDRPDFKSIRTKLRPLRKGMKPNIFDNMMAMMEKYANNLEVLVDERTDQLQEEKKKTEALLYEMLPRSVAEQLKRGHKVEAESFDCVTIYFSDIVGFTGMSAESTPLQVVDFLNDLYTCFDSIIENYDVYKVETIGDAYMVVSGLPIRNGYQHAAEIATMSLHLLAEVKHFSIRHMPTEKLKLRIGIHSGPVCAGVVGLKMPRYCLFGDTVNTASRMESTGLPLKIHCSKECRDLLLKLGGYNLVDRGLVSIKGKGDQITYWLLGEDHQKNNDRAQEREKRRAQTHNPPITNGQLDNGGLPGVPRSSLKNKNSFTRSPLPKCSSPESPKKLRFATENCFQQEISKNFQRYKNIPRCSSFESPKRLRFTAGESSSILEAIADSPSKKLSGSLLETSLECFSEALRTSSTSCPCIEHLASSAATLAHSQLSVWAKDEKHSYLSVPSLYSDNYSAVSRKVEAVSAPVSPNKRSVTLKLSVCEGCVLSEDNPWNDATPLLNTDLLTKQFDDSKV